MQPGHADKDNPGIRYNIYTLDYGTYVDLIGTSKEPQLTLFDMTDVHEEDQNRSSFRMMINEVLDELS